MRHLERVLRVGPGDAISYTDGQGTIGTGTHRDGAVVRGQEHSVARPSRPSIAMSPPKERHRLRFAVEKLTELGVPTLSFLSTSFGEGRPPLQKKLDAWVRAGVEQSRGAWAMECRAEPIRLGDIDPVWLAHPGGESPGQYDGGTIAIGPEGGFDEDEVIGHRLLDLGPTVLRVETAAVVAAVAVTAPRPE